MLLAFCICDRQNKIPYHLNEGMGIMLSRDQEMAASITLS